VSGREAGISAEQKMVQLAVGTEQRRQEARPTLETLARGADWSRLADLLIYARVLPTLGPRLIETAGGAASPSFERAVSESVQAVRRQDALLVLVCEQLLEALRGEGICAAALKGPALGERIYGEPGRRISSDIDLLLPAEQLGEAAEVAAGFGYGPPDDPLDEDGRPALHLAMVHERGQLPAVELHWRIHWYERSFARETLLPRTPTGPGWHPQPVHELAALLLYYARDGFTGVRQAADLGAWWDRFGDRVPSAGLEAAMAPYPQLRPALTTAAMVAARTVGLPAERLLHRPGLSARGRLARRLADPRPYRTTQQLYAEIGLIDGLLTPRGGLRAFFERQIAPPRAVIREHAERVHGAHVTSRAGYAIRVLGRYAIALGRVLRVPGAGRLRFASPGTG
jgi:Uncharacterised nucleotidyltransferase